MPINIKTGGAYKEMTNCQVKVNGEWKQALEVLTKVGGKWKQVWLRATVVRLTEYDSIDIPMEGVVDSDSVVTMHNCKFRCIDPATNAVVAEMTEANRVVTGTRKSVRLATPYGYDVTMSFTLYDSGIVRFKVENNPDKHILEYSYVSYTVVP